MAARIKNMKLSHADNYFNTGRDLTFFTGQWWNSVVVANKIVANKIGDDTIVLIQARTIGVLVCRHGC